MKQVTLKESIVEAIEEARILECARDFFEVDNVITTAMRLSGAPYSFTVEIYEKIFSERNVLTLPTESITL